MKPNKTLTILNIILLPILIFSQKVPYNTFDFKCNNLSASIGNNGLLFGTKAGNKKGGILIADGDESIKDVQLIYKSGFNMAGKLNGTQYGFGNLFDSECYPGPFETGPKNGMNYNKHWNVKGFEILGLIKDFENNGKLDKTPPINILTWPAKGNPYFENIEHFKLVNKSLAPFYDRDGDGIYDPYKGDYPVLDAACPTNIPWEMVWCIYHDSGIHFNYFANPISVEIHQMVYGYLEENNKPLSNTLFVRLSVTNYGETINDVYCGIFNDFDLGCPYDDYLGCNVQENTAFAYNSIPLDNDSCISSKGPIANFSTSSPFFSCTSLNKNLDGIMYFSNNPDNYNTNDPNTFNELYNYLKNKWKAGFPLTYGNTGFNPSSEDTVKFAFPGHPLDTSRWSMKSAKLPGADYRSMMNYYIGEYQNGETVIYDLSYTATKTQDEKYLEYTDTMITNINIIKEFYSDCKDSISFHNYCESDCVWPGDTDHNGIVNNHDLLNIGIANKTNGLQREVKFDGWAPLSSSAWIENNEENINFKNFDSNGNGIIDYLDTKALYYNFNKKNETYSNWGGFNFPGDNLRFNSEKQNYNSGDIIDLNIVFENKNSGDDIYGISTTIEYDSSLFQIVNHQFVENSPIGDLDQLLTFFIVDGNKIHLSCVRTSKTDTSNISGTMMHLRLLTRDTIAKDLLTNFAYSNYQTINKNGEIFSTTSDQYQVIINKTLSYENISLENISIFPNPASNEVNLKTAVKIRDVILSNSKGEEFKIQLNNSSFSTSNLMNGFYVIRIRDINGNFVNKKLIIQHN